MSDITGNSVQLGIAVDSSQAEAGFGKVEQGAQKMAQSVAQSGKQAGEGIKFIGEGGEEAAKKLDRGTKSIISSIQRATAEIKAAGSDRSAVFENLTSIKGLNNDAIKPYLDQLKQAEQAQRAATGSLDKMGVSAKQTAAALRGVPAQFTDIFTSLQGGQAPLTVFYSKVDSLKTCSAARVMLLRL